MTILHLTVDKTGLVSKWNSEEAARAQCSNRPDVPTFKGHPLAVEPLAYVALRLDARQEAQLQEAVRSLFPKPPAEPAIR